MNTGSGFKIKEAYIVFAFLIIALVSLIKRNVLTAMFSLFLQLVYLLVLFFLGVNIVWEYSNDIWDYFNGEAIAEVRVGTGFYFLTLTSIFYFIVLIVNLVKEIKNKKNHPDATTNILDDF